MYVYGITKNKWAFIILTHPSVLQELDLITYTRGGGSYFRSRSRGGLANFTAIAGMGHLISEPKCRIPTPPPPSPLLISDKSLRIHCFLKWDLLVLHWDPWFFTRWVPELTITICKKITVEALIISQLMEVTQSGHPSVSVQ